MRVRAWFCGVLCVAAVTACSRATARADWPQFLGPDRTGVAKDADDLPRTWPAGGPKVLWQVRVGVGFAGAAIFKDRVLLLDRETGKQDILRCFNLSDGKEIWRYAYSAPGKFGYPGSRSTPATDGRAVYSIGPMGHLKAVRFDNGRLGWEKNILRDWGAKRPTWAVAQSPLLLGDLLIIAPWGAKAAVVAYDKGTGEVKWTTPNRSGTALEYQSVVPMTLDGRQTVVTSGRKGYTIGVDAATGAEIWSFDTSRWSWQIPSPIVVDANRVLLVGGYRGGSVMLRLERAGNAYRARALWESKNLGSHTAQALLYDGHIYGNSTDTGGGLRCLTLDGQVKWDSGRSGRKFERGNIIIVGDLIFDVNGTNGALHMIEATPAGFKELGSARVLGGKQVWGPLVYSDGKLVLRDQGKLVCLDLKAR